MDDDILLNEALKKVTNRSLLINMVARRVRQLNAGARPMVKTDNLPPERIALKEIAEGKLEARVIGEGRRVAGEVKD